jgi:hypothetical protein
MLHRSLDLSVVLYECKIWCVILAEMLLRTDSSGAYLDLKGVKGKWRNIRSFKFCTKLLT